MLISAAAVVTPTRVLEPGWVEVEGDRIAAVEEGEPPGPVDSHRGRETIAPGFVDAHVHGGGGASFTTGSTEDAARVAAAHLAAGTTTMVASLVTDTAGSLDRAVRALSELVADGLLCGVHLEGPWLSPLHAGAHDPALLLPPDRRQIDRLVEAGAGSVAMVTLAPELPGGLDAVHQITASGLVCAVGHTDATYEVTSAAIEAGARVGTHLFNTMRRVHHREPGPAIALLGHPDCYVELIADGVHLHPAVLRHAAATKPDRFVLVTDAMAAAASADGDYLLGPLTVQVRDGVARLADTGAIAGSTLTMARAVQYAVREARVPFADVVRAATSTPARMLGLDHVGELLPGRLADLVVLGGDLDVTAVMRRGRWLPRP